MNQDDTWVLITSVKPNNTSEKNTTSMIDTMIENRVTPQTQFTLISHNLTDAIKVDDKITKIEQTTLEMGLSSSESSSSESSIGLSSEETSSEEIDEEFTTSRVNPINSSDEDGETKPIESSEEEEEKVTTDVINGNEELH